MVHPEILARAHYRSSPARGVLLGLAGLGLALAGIGGVAAAALLLVSVFPPAWAMLLTFCTGGFLLGVQLFVLSVPALGLVGLAVAFSRARR